MSEPVTVQQIAGHLLVKIRNAGLLLEVLTEDLARLARQPHSVHVSTKVMELAKCVTRRNALIEVWEFATNERWTGD